MEKPYWEGKDILISAIRNVNFCHCHKNADPDDFNCLFCYCPLYALGGEMRWEFPVYGKGN